ncbi:MAG: NifU family protein [Actinobacteria bacterium]|nr:NifU family protein [Actinomycetota bacterium]
MNVDAVGRRVEDLLDQIAARDEVAAELTEELVRELMALYGAGLGRLLDRMAGAAPEALRALTTDPLVDGLLMLHDLHPDDIGARIEAALEEVRPYLASHGGGVQLLGVADGVAHLQLEGSCEGCGSSQVTLQHAVEGAVLEAAPEIERLEVAGVTAPSANGLIPAESLSLRRRDVGGGEELGWEPLPAADAPPDLVATQQVNGARLAIVRIDDQLYAYRDACPSCDGSLAGGPVHGDLLDCPGCGSMFDVRRAGRAADGGRGLDPVPLLDDGDGVRVAAGALR